MADDTKLSSSVTVKNYRDLVSSGEQAKAHIIKFIKERFTERYIAPVTTGEKNGFTMMAVACLMIEALQSFYLGEKDSDRQSALFFCYFFDRNPNFAFIRGYGREFYKHVRCGILHQAETTGGWRINRKKTASVFDATNRNLQADKFLTEVKNALDAYCTELSNADWGSPVWSKFKKKMNYICNNCG